MKPDCVEIVIKTEGNEAKVYTLNVLRAAHFGALLAEMAINIHMRSPKWEPKL